MRAPGPLSRTLLLILSVPAWHAGPLSLVPAAAQTAGRPALADEVERRFKDRFLFTTAGDGLYTIYQRVEANLAEPHEIACMMRDCFVRLGAAPAEALERAGADPETHGRLLDLFRDVRASYDALLRAAPGEKLAAERAWFAEARRVEACLSGREC
jgi:hypothetical protein